jgi:hypothetical protein
MFLLILERLEDLVVLEDPVIPEVQCYQIYQ